MSVKSIPNALGLEALLLLTPRALRVRLAWLVVSSVVGGVAELLTVGAVVPLLLAVIDPARLATLPIIGSILTSGLRSVGANPVLACAILVAGCGVAAAAVRIHMLWLSQRFVYDLHRSIVERMYSGALSQSYEWFARHHGADFAATIDKVYALAANLLVSAVAAIPAIFMSVGILGFLLLLSPAIALTIAAALGTMYLALAYFALRRVDHLSQTAVSLRDRRSRLAQETWGAARDIILDRSQAAYLAEASRLEHEFAELHVRASMLGLMPRILIDAAILILVAVIIALLAGTRADLLAALPLLAAFAVGGQRLIPLLQQIYLAYANQKFYQAYVGDALGYAELVRPAESANFLRGLVFKSSIELRNVSFGYAGGINALHDVDVTVPRGSKVAVLGKSGSGKSTLVDLIMGLIRPTTGSVLIDGVDLSPGLMAAWHAKIAHVPQNIFLTDDSLLANVAFGHRADAIDPDRALNACLTADLGELIAESPDGMMRRLGERGIQLSGGQRQRIGIARALYKGAELLVLDEATGALDVETEARVLEGILSRTGEMTVIVISHRASALKFCDQVIRLKNGRISDG